MSKTPGGMQQGPDMMGQGRAPNTLQLRNMYSEYAIQQQSAGQQPMDFETWAGQMFPGKQILNQQQS